MSEAPKKVLAILGSTKRHSSNEALLNAIQERHKAQLKVDIYNGLANLPHFNPDITSKKVPSKVAHFRELINRADGVLICTPEYVVSLPAVLKNAIEWTVGTTVFTDKPLAYIIASASGEKAFESLQLIMSTLQATIADDSRLLIKGIKSKFDEQGRLTDSQTAREIDQLVHSFISTMNASENDQNKN